MAEEIVKRKESDYFWREGQMNAGFCLKISF